MKIALFHNASKTSAQQTALTIQKRIAHFGIEIVHLPQDGQKMAQSAIDDVDFCLIIGGDGTILRFVHTHGEIKAPLLGINQGGLGFMADVPISDLLPCLDDLIKGAFSIQDRAMLKLKLPQGKSSKALNEVIFHRGQNNGVVELSLRVDDRFVNTFSGDGLIIATPNGSTAYSLSAGGPIMAPELKAILVTPICPHAIANRPLVLPATSSLSITIAASQRSVDVVIDGFTRQLLERGEIAVIAENPDPFRWVNLHRRDYFATLRDKLGWSGSLKNRS